MFSVEYRASRFLLAFALATLAFIPCVEIASGQVRPTANSDPDIDRRIKALEDTVQQLRAQPRPGLQAPVFGTPTISDNAERISQPVPSNGTYSLRDQVSGNSIKESILGICQPCDPNMPRDGAGGSKKYPLVRITGFFQLDTIFQDQTAQNIKAVGRAQDAMDFRRARIAATGNLTDDVTYLMEFDFASSQSQFVDLWANWANIPVLGNVRIGRFRQPFGMAELTSVREIPFLERPLTFTFAPFRQTGVSIWDSALDERVTWAISGYRFQTDAFGNVVGNSGYGTAARLTGLPLYTDDHHLMHLGFGYSYNEPAIHALTYSTFPEVFGGSPGTGVNSAAAFNNPTFANTGLISLNNVNLFNIETALVYGSFALQSETRWSMLDQTKGGGKTLGSTYVEAKYVLTGEEINYNKKNAVLTRVIPLRPLDFKGNRGCGAWELAMRWSYIDLNGTNGNGPGGLLNDYTVGLNWYMNNFTKFQFNYIRSLLDQRATGTSSADFYALRFQMDF
jgi:phosphate-selective porin OprO/OprP